MKRFIKKAAIILALVSATTVVFADRGTGRKGNKTKTNLNIVSSSSSMKSTIMSNLKNGLSYKGSLSTTKHTNNTPIANNTLMAYQKGNTTYLLPYKNKVAVADMSQGYTGVKLIIRSKK